MAETSERCVPCDIEARKLYAAIFGREIPVVVLERFLVASEQMNAQLVRPEFDRYYHTVTASGDLEALEVAARWTNRLPELSRRVRLMVYLAETLPENQQFFINERTSLLAGLWSVSTAGVHTAFKLVKGLYLLQRYRRA